MLQQNTHAACTCATRLLKQGAASGGRLTPTVLEFECILQPNHRCSKLVCCLAFQVAVISTLTQQLEQVGTLLRCQTL